MAGRDTPRSRDPDDWFVEPATSRRERQVEVPPAPSSPESDEADDWLGNARRARLRRESALAASLSDRWVAIAAGVLLVACVIVGVLVLSGAFGGSKHKPAAATTPNPSTATATTTTQSPAATVSPPTTTLKPGDQGTQVKALQRALARLGYSVGAVDGNYGTATKSAVARFQSTAKLTADGLFGPATLAALVTALRNP